MRTPTPRHCARLSTSLRMPTPPSLCMPLLVIAHAFPRHCARQPLVIARRHAEAIQCRSLSKTGLPRFLAEPRNDSENANPSAIAHASPRHCYPFRGTNRLSLRGGTPKQSIAVHCQKLDCRGSLRNLAMTAKMPTPRHCACQPLRHCEAARRSNPLRFIAENWIAAVPCGTSQ